MATPVPIIAAPDACSRFPICYSLFRFGTSAFQSRLGLKIEDKIYVALCLTRVKFRGGQNMSE